MSILSDIVDAFFTSRSINGIVPDVTIEEKHSDTLETTDHPVELGAEITDHAFMRPADLVMHVGWSKSSGMFGSNDLTSLYDKFLALQASREPFDVSTGKRAYSNMLIKQITETTTVDTENALKLTLYLKQIIIVQTETTALKPDSNQADPAKTGNVTNAGTKQAIKAPAQTALKVLLGG